MIDAARHARGEGAAADRLDRMRAAIIRDHARDRVRKRLRRRPRGRSGSRSAGRGWQAATSASTAPGRQGGEGLVGRCEDREGSFARQRVDEARPLTTAATRVVWIGEFDAFSTMLRSSNMAAPPTVGLASAAPPVTAVAVRIAVAPCHQRDLRFVRIIWFLLDWFGSGCLRQHQHSRNGTPRSFRSGGIFLSPSDIYLNKKEKNFPTRRNPPPFFRDTPPLCVTSSGASRFFIRHKRPLL
jgi:hypothetical protein